MAKNFRLFIKENLEIGKIITLDENQTHYLKDVVKYGINDNLLCFDNQNGEFICQLIETNKKGYKIKVLKKTKEKTQCPDIWLLFAPLKKDNTDFVIEKATELGCRCIIPTITQNTNTTNIKLERYIAQSIEAAEQCRRTDLPEITSPQSLTSLLETWPCDRSLYFMDESLQSAPFLQILKTAPNNKAAILIGPEGGFSPEELNRLRNSPFALGATLGPRILRAETAALAALSCWQLIVGDWNIK